METVKNSFNFREIKVGITGSGFTTDVMCEGREPACYCSHSNAHYYFHAKAFIVVITVLQNPCCRRTLMRVMEPIFCPAPTYTHLYTLNRHKKCKDYLKLGGV